MSIRISTFRPAAVGVFAGLTADERSEVQFDAPVSTETPRGFYLRVRVPGIGYFLPKDTYEEINQEWRVA